ncbi:hypothetical protein Q9966_007330 [Columba livia]|nr:hypothetical protein Q9966_007330 [Columba livia]
MSSPDLGAFAAGVNQHQLRVSNPQLLLCHVIATKPKHCCFLSSGDFWAEFGLFSLLLLREYTDGNRAAREESSPLLIIKPWPKRSVGHGLMGMLVDSRDDWDRLPIATMAGKVRNQLAKGQSPERAILLLSQRERKGAPGQPDIA